MAARPIDSGQLDHIVREHSPNLRSYIRGKVRNAEDAEDVLQEVFYQLARTSAEGGSIERVSSWLYKVARNTILNFWRRQSTLSFSTMFYDDGEMACEELSEALFCEDSSTPESKYLRSLVWHELEQALGELPLPQREVFCLTVFDGVPVKDIAAAAGVPIATLLSRKHYAVKFLRGRLNALYDELIFT